MPKITRDAFLYLEMRGEDKDFAQCSDCALYRGKEKRCLIHGPTIEVASDASCGFFFKGASWDVKQPPALVTPTESGLVHRQVRCENCRFFKRFQRCGLFDMLNTTLPHVFDLDPKVKPQACCNAQEPKVP